MDKAIFILGPTGVGKSEVAINLAKKFNGEIISADAVQIFKGFDIGSAKIREKDMQNIVHYGIDLCEPEQEFTVYDFVQFTRQKIAQISARGKLPFVVGGTGLYIRAMLEGYDFGGADKHQEFRANLEEFARQNGNLALWQELEKLDGDQAKQIPPNNVKRVIRALEIKKFGTEKGQNAIDFKAKVYALTMAREHLYEKINNRVDIMFQNGLIDEVKNLLKTVKVDAQPMQAIGYKEIVKALQGEISLQQAKDLIKQHSRNYAKRQMTFIRGMSGVEMIDVSNPNDIQKMQEEIKFFMEEK